MMHKIKFTWQGFFSFFIVHFVRSRIVLEFFMKK